ncbi:MAG: hypothetical protein KAI16_02555 [Candidatus Pacebacteria bacterium]|nr:hypothetical protein [Candidatus Paceibacterota bacterium]
MNEKYLKKFIDIFPIIFGCLLFLVSIKCFFIGLVAFSGYPEFVVGLFCFFVAVKLFDWSWELQDDYHYSKQFEKTNDDFENRFNLNRKDYENN